MKVFGRKVISKLTKSIRSRPSSFSNRGAVRKGILNARSPGARGSDYVKRTVNTAPQPTTTTSRWDNLKSKAKLIGLGLGGATGFSSLSASSQGGKDSENINIYVKRNTFHGTGKK